MSKENWVEFDETAYELLKVRGFKYFVFIGMDDEHKKRDETIACKLYPYKTQKEAQNKLNEVGYFTMNNYIMEIDEPLDELAQGVDLLKVKVLI